MSTIGIDDNGFTETWGDRPLDDRGQAEPLYGYVTEHQNGYSFGGGLWNGPFGRGDESGNGSAFWASGGVGEWSDQNGVSNWGIGVEGGIGKASSDNAPKDGSATINGDVGAGTFSAGAYHNQNTTGFGAQANAAEASVTLGNKEHNYRAGLSAGTGFAARWHHGDADHDGTRELGVGFDAGPFSMDVRSEALGEVWNLVTDIVDPPGV